MDFESYELKRQDGAGRAVTLRGRSVGPADGPSLLMLASLGRPGTDFDEVAAALAGKGFRVTLPEPRGLGGSEGPMEELTLHDLAEDVAHIIERVARAPVALAGHAFGTGLRGRRPPIFRRSSRR